MQATGIKPIGKKYLFRNDCDDGVLSLESIKLLVLPVAKKNSLNSIVLFGSYARNEANSKSDIDLIIDGGNYTGLFGFMEIKAWEKGGPYFQNSIE